MFSAECYHLLVPNFHKTHKPYWLRIGYNSSMMLLATGFFTVIGTSQTSSHKPHNTTEVAFTNEAPDHVLSKFKSFRVSWTEEKSRAGSRNSHKLMAPLLPIFGDPITPAKECYCTRHWCTIQQTHRSK